MLIAAYHFLLGIQDREGLFAPIPHARVFGSMALHLLEGRFDVDPEAIGDEAFVRGGRTYAYFGVFPAVLRMPLIPFLNVENVPLSQLYTFLALLTGAFAQASAVRIVFRPVPTGPGRQLIEPLMIAAALLSGPSVMLAMKGTVFDETNGWAWALASAFTAVAMHGLTASAGFRGQHLSAMAILAGLCLHTRATTALGLHVSLALMLLWLALRDRSGSTVGVSGFARRCFQPKLFIPAVIVTVFAVAAGVVNDARWGHPLVLADLRAQIHLISAAPDRLVRLDTYGLFHIGRLGYGFLYYFVPMWPLRSGNGFLFEGPIRELFDALELPPSSFFLSDPLTMTLAVLAVPALLRNRLAGLPRAGVVALLAGLCVAPTLMLIAWYMAFRYRLEFSPLFLALACIGGPAFAQRMNAWPKSALRIPTVIFVLLFVAQVLSAHLHALLYVLSPFGPAHDHLAETFSSYAGALAQLFGLR